MAIGEEAGRKTVADLNQYVRTWLAELKAMGIDLETLQGKRLRLTGNFTLEIEDKPQKEP